MAIVVKNKFVEENIEDENGNVLGVLRFNPEDSRIMSRLVECVDYLEKGLKKIKEKQKGISNMNIEEIKIESIEDAENVSEYIEKTSEALKIEEDCSDKIINELSEIFGKDVVELFTGGTKDITSVEPILEFAMPYVKKARTTKMNKYIKKNKDIEVLD